MIHLKNYCLLTALVVLVACAFQFPSTAQELQFARSEFETLSLEEGYCYMGNGEFMSLRSCRVGHICVDLDRYYFDISDSTLYISGLLSDCWNPRDVSDMHVRLLVGLFDEDYTREFADSSEWIVSGPNGSVSLGNYAFTANAYMNILEYFDIDDNDNFELDIEVLPGTYLCFVAAEADYSESFEMVVTEIYDIGRLLEIHRPGVDSLPDERVPQNTSKR